MRDWREPSDITRIIENKFLKAETEDIFVCVIQSTTLDTLAQK
jgi:hypothetical protein